MQGTEAVSRLVLANAEKNCAINMPIKALCWQNVERTSLASCRGLTRPAVLSLEQRRSELKRLLHEVQSCRPRAFVHSDQQEAPTVSLS